MKDREAPRSTPVREPINPASTPKTGSEPQTINTDLPAGRSDSETEADRLRRQSSE